MSSNIDTFNAVTGGVFNQLSLTQLVRNIYNISTNKPNWQQQFVFGNNGIVLDNYAQNNSIKSTAINFIGDMIIPSQDKILETLKNANLYGEKYVQNKPNISKIKEALKYIGTLIIMKKGED